MNLAFRRSQKKTMWGYYRFELQARFDLTNDERQLVSKYSVENRILSEGDPLRDLKRAAWWAAAGALIVMVIDYVAPFVTLYVAPFVPLGGLRLTGLASTILLGLISFLALTWFIYHQLREEIRIQDMITGRFFNCRSVLRLVEKESSSS